MERFTKKISIKKSEFIINEYLVAGFVVEEKKHIKDHLIITFVRDLKSTQLNEAISDYKIFKKTLIPSIIPLFIFIPISIVLFTIFLILILNDKDNSMIYLLTLLIPGIISFLAGSIYSIYRMRRITFYISEGDKLQKELILKAKKRLEE